MARCEVAVATDSSFSRSIAGDPCVLARDNLAGVGSNKDQPIFDIDSFDFPGKAKKLPILYRLIAPKLNLELYRVQELVAR